MDQIKIGNFIKERRNEKNLTQSELAEKLMITDRAISKWENGICLPDSGTMPDLCEILDITINDLFSGEIVDMKKYNETADKHLLELKEREESLNKKALRDEVIIGIMSTIILVSSIVLVSLIELPKYLNAIIVTAAIIMFVIGIIICMDIETKAGYYECKHCHHKYIPTYLTIWTAMHFCRTRYMKCPECGKKSWQKKVLSK